MVLAAQLAKHFKEVHFGGNWTDVNLKNTLEGISWQEATTSIYSFNTIAILVFHMHYYVGAILEVLEGKPLDASDKFSFNLPPMLSEDDWYQLKEKTFADAKRFSDLLEKLPDSKLWKDFSESKYGTYHRNLLGVMEHCLYHLGQIVLIKKISQDIPK